jgi:hypothetical protein
LLNYPLSAEQICLLTLARTTWTRRGVAKHRKLVFQEESVTETVLQDLALTFPGRLTIRPFNKLEEGQNGADWAWAFVSADGKLSAAMLVQAKALDLKDKRYGKIDQKAAKSSGMVLQIDALLASAAKIGIPAVYAFYNHLTDTSKIPDHCQTLRTSAPGFPVESWGISVADAQVVNTTLPDKRFLTHRGHSMPLHCLLCSRAIGRRPAGGSPEAALRALARLAQLGRGRPMWPESEPEDEEHLARLAVGDFDDEILLQERLRAPLPPIFDAVRRLDEIDDEDECERAVTALAADYPDLAGVVIMTDDADEPRVRRT